MRSTNKSKTELELGQLERAFGIEIDDEISDYNKRSYSEEFITYNICEYNRKQIGKFECAITSVARRRVEGWGEWQMTNRERIMWGSSTRNQSATNYHRNPQVGPRQLAQLSYCLRCCGLFRERLPYHLESACFGSVYLAPGFNYDCW